MELFVIYLWLKVDLFINIFTWVLAPITLIVLLVYAIARSEKDSYSIEQFKTNWDNKLKKFLIISGTLFTIGILTPDSKDIAILVGASYAVDFAKSPEGAKIGTLIRKKANDYLDEQLKEVAKEQQPAASKP